MALVDSGCSQSIISQRLAGRIFHTGRKLTAVNGSVLQCGVSEVHLSIDSNELSIPCLVLESLISEYELIIGIDVINKLGGLHLGGADGSVRFGLVANCSDKIEIDDKDFVAKFDGMKWTVRWKWIAQEPLLSNKIPNYKIDNDIRDEFDREVDSWIEEGILQPVPDFDEVTSVLPLLAVQQTNKGKIRPVLDYKELNQYVSCHTGSSAVCNETIRRWRTFGNKLALLDLRKAYLQLHVDRSMWKYQVVRFKNKHYYLTRLGFGLNCAPKIMDSILKSILAKVDTVNRATDNYLDDVLVNEDLIPSEVVACHLRKYGLETKPSVDLSSGAKVLGLLVEKTSAGELVWKRSGCLPTIPEDNERFTRRELFSVCGQLIGHYPVAGWLRTACGFIKRQSEGTAWEDDIGDRAREMIKEVLTKLHSCDPVRGQWFVTSKKGRIWCDASSLALGCALEINGNIVEDGAWLRKDDATHINLAELESVLKGLNLAAKWKLQSVEILTDSVSVLSWLQSVLLDTHVVKTKGMSEMLVRRRLSVIRDVCMEYNMDVSVSWVESNLNKADGLTRVCRRWLQRHDAKLCCLAVDKEAVLRRIHEEHHFGVDRTYYLAKMKIPTITKDQVSKLVKACCRCQSIDPAPVRLEKGSLSVDTNWTRLAVDVTHFNGSCYLSMIDCGPGRFAIWRKLRDESSESILPELREVFRERGPPEQLLMDNGSAFRSSAVVDLLKLWGVKSVYRCAYKPEGNSIVERHHRTIKRMAARANGDPLQMVFWYNVTPKESSRAESLPSASVHNYDWRLPGISEVSVEKKPEMVSGLHRGDQVYVKPPRARCTSTWPVGTITEVLSDYRVEVDGVPRHVGDLRAVCPPSDGEDDVQSEESLEDISERPSRTVRRPDYYGNNIFDT